MQDENTSVEMNDEELYEGWEEDTVPEEAVTDEPEEDPETADPAEEEETEDDETEETAETEEDNKEEEPKEEAKETDQFFELKYMGETKKINSNDIVPLAQKGMDYDRIRAERDELKSGKSRLDELEEVMKDAAEITGLTQEEFIDNIRARAIQAKAEKDGKPITEEEAAKQAKSLRETKAKEKAAESKADKQTADEQAEKEKSRASIQKFMELYPNVKAQDIPQEVWEEAGKTGDLAGAYTRYENKRLKAELEAERQNKKNKERSTGPRRSTGKSEDKWFEGWADD